MKFKYYIPVASWAVLALFLLFKTLIPLQIVYAQDDIVGNTIAGIQINEKKKSEIQLRLATEIEKWKENEILVQGETAEVIIPSSYINFDITKTVDHYIVATSKPWYKIWGSSINVEIPIEVTLDESVIQLLEEAPLIKLDETANTIIEHASFLKTDVVVPKEIKLSTDNMERVSFEMHDINVNADGLEQIANTVDGTTIVNGEQFSLLNKIEDANVLYSEEAANFIASVLYSVVLQSELDIQERHSQNVIPPYLLPGIEAKVQRDLNEDFQFFNNTNSPFILKSSIEGNELKIELYSLQVMTNVTYKMIGETKIKPRIIYRYSSDLATGSEKLIQEGKSGIRVSVLKTISEKEGSYESEEVIAKDFYPPIHQIVLRSSKQPVLETPSTSVPPMDLDGNELPDINDNDNDEVMDAEHGEEPTSGDNNLEGLPDGSHFDKGGNLIIPGVNDSY